MTTSSRLARFVVAALAAGSLVTIAATTAGATHARVVTSHIAPCGGFSTVDWINTQGNGAAGSIYYQLEFTNLSGASCTLNGYPGVSAVDLAGNQVGGAATRSTATHHAVTVAKGATVKARLQITDAGNFAPSACAPVTVAGLRVYAPNVTKGKLIPFPFTACSKVSNPNLHVGPVS